MGLSDAVTIVGSLRALPRVEDRGFTFRTVTGSERHYAWEELCNEAEARAQRLVNIGLRSGDRLALVVADPAQFVLSFLAALVAGVVPVPIYPRASFKAKDSYTDSVAHIVEAAGARMLLTTIETRPLLDDLAARDTKLEKIVILEEFVTGDTPEIQLPEVRPEDICFLQFTSGSTSMPKGVVVSHASLMANARDFLGPHGLDRRHEDNGVTWLPLYHDMGLIGFMLGSVICDIPIYFMPTESFARRPGLWLEKISERRATLTFAPNFAYALATKRARERDLETLDLSSLRIAGCGAEPISAEVMRGFNERFAPAGLSKTALLPCYGMAEATLAITFGRHDGPIETKRVDAEALGAGRIEPPRPGAKSLEFVSCGRPFPGSDLRIVSEDGEVLGENRVGEIHTRGPGITAGYYENPEGSASSFVDGWLRTGDLGFVCDGQVYICGRLKDLIIVRGANHYPQDIEWAVAKVPGVRRDNVVAFSVSRDGEEQLVVTAEGHSSDAAELRRTIAAKVAETAGIRAQHVVVVRVGSLPKTTSGKVQRRRTKALFEAGALEEHPVGNGPGGN